MPLWVATFPENDSMNVHGLPLILGCMALAVYASEPEAPTPQPLAPPPATLANGSKPGSAPRVLAPMMSETRVIRRADGSLVLQCVDRPNPQARAILERVRSRQQGVPQP